MKLRFAPDDSIPGRPWAEVLARSKAASEVVALARDFLAALTPQEVELLPEACRPRKLLTADDVNTYAFDLVSHDCDSTPGARDLVLRLSAFFAAAANRLAAIAAAQGPVAHGDGTRGRKRDEDAGEGAAG